MHDIEISHGQTTHGLLLALKSSVHLPKHVILHVKDLLLVPELGQSGLMKGRGPVLLLIAMLGLVRLAAFITSWCCLWFAVILDFEAL